MAVRRQLGRTGLTVSAESGHVDDGLRFASVRDLVPGQMIGKPAPFARFGLAADRRFGRLSTQATLAWLREDRTLLGASLHPGLAPRGADTVMLDLAGQWDLASDWTLGAAWRRAETHARYGAVIARGSSFASDGWRLDLVHRNVFARDDNLALRISQPLRVAAGGLQLRLPVAWNYATDTATTQVDRLDLTPSGREVDAELRWQGPLFGGQASASLYARRQPGNIAAMPDEQGVAVAWRTGF